MTSSASGPSLDGMSSMSSMPRYHRSAAIKNGPVPGNNSQSVAPTAVDRMSGRIRRRKWHEKIILGEGVILQVQERTKAP